MIGYLLEITVCWGILYLIFFLGMRRETFFGVNRFYLLTSMLLGTLFPLLYRIVSLDLFVDRGQGDVELLYMLQNARMNLASNVVANVPSFSEVAIYAIWIVYLGGAIFFLAQLMKGLFSIYRLNQEGRSELHPDHEILWSNKPHLPFSFFNKIYVSEVMPVDKDLDRILKHELAHVKAWHSVDILVAEVLTVIFWFHPLIYLYKTALRQTHEYLADDRVVRSEGSRQLYGELLLRQSLSGLEMALVHQFFQSHIKKRVHMIYQKRSGKWTWLKYVLSIPVFGALALSFTGYSAEQNDTETESHNVGQIESDHNQDRSFQFIEVDENGLRHIANLEHDTDQDEEVAPGERASLASTDSLPLIILDTITVVTTKKISEEDSDGLERDEEEPQKKITGVVKDGSLEVFFEGNKNKVTLQLHDMEGGLIQEPVSFSGSEVTKHNYDVSHLPNGIYIISAIQDKEIASSKISIVQ